MKATYKYFILQSSLLIGLALLPSMVAAQHITFESADEYKSIGVYDSWEQSPFRTNVLNGTHYVSLAANPDTEAKETPGVATNASANVLAVQRSRYGSNTFGARIDLNEPFCLGTSKKYVHVLTYKPVGENASVMLIGLGKRHDWDDQAPETEQFWVTASLSTQGQWNDLVFPITTNESVDIYSFVVVPDLASPHLRPADFVAYIDDIEVNNSTQPRYQTINYPLTFDADQAPTRTDRALTKLTFTGESTQDVTVPTTTVYNNLTETAMVKAKAGGEVTVKITYKGAWMSGYVYVDWNNDGQFTPVISEHQPASGSELVSYTFLSGYNSNGVAQSNGNSVVDGAITCPAFTVPAGTQPGVYRMRLKVDWDSDDPGGNNNTGNLITANGGAIVDVLLNVHEDNVIISANQLNGDVLTTGGAALSDAPIPFGQSFAIKMAPAPGFTYTGIVLTHGYNLDGPEYVRENRQYKSVTIPASSFDNTTKTYTIPASYIDGEVRIEGLFTPGSDPDPGNEVQTYTVIYKNGANGTFYQGGNAIASGGWNAAEWVSAEPAPIVTLSNNANNGFNTNNYNLAVNRTFTISVAGDYVITGYKIYTAAGWGTTITTEGGESAVFSGEQTLTISGLNTTSTWFTTADANLNGPVIEVYIQDAVPDFTAQVTANIQPFTTYPGTGYFRVSSENAATLAASITAAKADGVVNESEYNNLLTSLVSYVNFPATGYYLIKNGANSRYLAYGTPGESTKSEGLITTAEITPANIIRLTKVGQNEYTISSQGLNVQIQAAANKTFPMTTADGAHFAFVPKNATSLKIANAESYIDETKPGTLFEGATGEPKAVVNWNPYNEQGEWTIEDANSVAINLTAAKDNTSTVHTYATLCVPFEITALTGAASKEVKAFTPTMSGTSILTGSGASTITAGTPVILIGEEGSTSVTATIGSNYAATPATTNILTGTFAGTSIDPSAATGTNYVLGFDEENDNRIGFYHVNQSSIDLAPNRAYLHIEGSSVKGFVINFDEADHIDSTLMDKEAVIYNIAGQRMSKLQKGVNIVNDKKVLVK